MVFNDNILEKANLFNHVLEKINTSTIFENPDFVIDEMSSEFYLKFNLKKSDNVVNISIVLTNFGIEINVDRVPEAFTWSDKQINDNEILNFIEILLTSGVRVQYCGANYTKLEFVDTKGKTLKSLKYVSGLYLKINCSVKEYLPIYSNE